MAQDEQMAKAMLVQQKYTDELLQKPHVVGVGVGMVQQGGAPTGEVGLVVMVDEKLPSAQLAPRDLIPPEIEGVRVDVQEIGQPRAY